MKIEIEFIPADKQRYDTLGDWYWDDDQTLRIFASDDDGEDAAFLVAFHELAEAWLCRKADVSEEDVTSFDLAFLPPNDDPDAEPGDDPDAPYKYQHRQAMMLEMMMALFMGKIDYGVMR